MQQEKRKRLIKRKKKYRYIDSYTQILSYFRIFIYIFFYICVPLRSTFRNFKIITKIFTYNITYKIIKIFSKIFINFFTKMCSKCITKIFIILVNNGNMKGFIIYFSKDFNSFYSKILSIFGNIYFNNENSYSIINDYRSFN